MPRPPGANGSSAAVRAPDQTPPDLELDQRFDASSLGLLRTAVATHAAAAGLSADRVQDAVIAIHELAANAVHHGAGHGRVQQWADGSQLCCHVSDPGRASHPATRFAGRAPWPANYGHGLWLVSQAADHVVVEHAGAGTTVTVRFAIEPEWPAGN